VADKILVLDFGSQYNQLIARRIREMGVFSELMPHDLDVRKLKEDPELKGIVFSGGPNSVYDANAFLVDPQIYSLGLPILGICYGMQLMAHQLKGEVKPGSQREYGNASLKIQHSNALCVDLPMTQGVWMSHGDHVTQVPAGFRVDGVSEHGITAVMSDPQRKFYGLQFHPEVRNTEYGNEWIEHFVFDVCAAQDNWKLEDFITQQVVKMRCYVPYPEGLIQQLWLRYSTKPLDLS